MSSIHFPQPSIQPRRPLALIAVALASLSLASCSQGPARVNQPYIDADAAGALAMDQYDTNGDGVVAGDELDKVPALKSSLTQLDTDKDGGVSADEIATVIQHWQEMPLGMMAMGFKLTLDWVPVEDATVTFEPEELLGGNVKPAVATTDSFGTGGPVIPKEQRPDPAHTPPGVQMGFYKVKVSKTENNKETIPAKYNLNTVFGQLIMPDETNIMNRRVVYAMTTK